jgi:predicted transglutaminase-like cysteine proteinase
MNRFAKLSFAAAALTLTALAAAPASAADVVVKLGGKTPAQISAELEKAAKSVCRDEVQRTTLIDLTSCIEFVFNDAVAQLPPTIVVPTK